MSQTSTNKAAITSSVIDVTSGNLVLDGCTFSGITLASNSLINLNGYGSRLSIEGQTQTKFTSITKNSGNGAVLSETLSSDLTITNVLFESCVAVAGSGGAIEITPSTHKFVLKNV